MLGYLNAILNIGGHKSDALSLLIVKKRQHVRKSFDNRQAWTKVLRVESKLPKYEILGQETCKNC